MAELAERRLRALLDAARKQQNRDYVRGSAGIHLKAGPLEPFYKSLLTLDMSEASRLVGHADEVTVFITERTNIQAHGWILVVLRTLH